MGVDFGPRWPSNPRRPNLKRNSLLNVYEPLACQSGRHTRRVTLAVDHFAEFALLKAVRILSSLRHSDGDGLKWLVAANYEGHGIGPRHCQCCVCFEDVFLAFP